MGFVLCLVEIIVKAVVKVTVTTLAKKVMSRLKGKTAPTDPRDGSLR